MDNRVEILKKEKAEDEDGLNVIFHVLMDKRTGVMYLANCFGCAGGITPLLDKDGKPLTMFEANIREGELAAAD